MGNSAEDFPGTGGKYSFLTGSARFKITALLSFLVALIVSVLTALVIGKSGLVNYHRADPVVLMVLTSAAVFILFYLFLMRKYLRRLQILMRPIPDEWEKILIEEVSYYRSRSQDERERFKRSIQLFLGEKRITGIETEVDEKCRLLVASSAIIPVFRFPEWEYDKLGEVLIYPSNFDDSFQFDQDNRDILGMVVSQSSAMIISKPALYEGFRNDKDGSNVGIHEFIHKIDEEDGVIDGVPGLMIDKKTASKWVDIVEKEMLRIEKGMSDINPYGGSDPVEFFPVVSEYFFEKPSEMKDRHPELYSILKKIFKQDTVSILRNAAQTMFSRGPQRIGKKFRQ